jgi:diguanylate cyclase (GGDEF)-like protein/PAS domain S-box-containing protein
MSNKEPVRLLILEESENRAEELIVLLRTAGRATRAHQIESEADLTECLTNQAWDLLVARNEASGLSAEQVIVKIHDMQRDIPAIILADDQDHETIVEGLKLGAKDVALDDDDERLVLIIERELENLSQRRQRRRAEVDLREAERRNQLLLDSSTAAIGYVHEGMHIYTNEAYADLFGYVDPDDFAGIPIIDLITSEDQSKFKEFLKSFQDQGIDTEEFNCVNSDDSRVPVRLSLSPASYEGESCTQVIFRALTDDTGVDDRIKEISSQDLLTGLFNRQYFNEQLDVAVDQASDGKHPFVLFYISVDHFSQIRSDAGLSSADLILADLAALIRGQIDESHLLARFGDDVFTLLYRDSDKDNVSAVAEALRGTIEKHLCEVSGKTYQATVSIGMAFVSESAPSAQEVVSRAHEAATDIEEGNGVNFYQSEQVQTGEDDQGMSSDILVEMLRTGLEDNTLKLLFQPVISLHGDDDEQFEVLLRLLDAEGNEMAPGKFLGPAENAGLLEKMDRWVILHSIKGLAEHREQGHKTRLFINITHKSMADETFLPWINVALKAAKLPSDAIIFQIHESDATSYIKQASRFSKGLAQLHCKVSINHFGCSLNPFNLLTHLSPDYVKLDGSFAQKIEASKEKQTELVDMVKSLQGQGVLTAISGVESPTVLQTLWMSGLNFIQGYYVSPPLDNLEYDFAAEGL